MSGDGGSMKNNIGRMIGCGKSLLGLDLGVGGFSKSFRNIVILKLV